MNAQLENSRGVGSREHVRMKVVAVLSQLIDLFLKFGLLSNFKLSRPAVELVYACSADVVKDQESHFITIFL